MATWMWSQKITALQVFGSSSLCLRGQAGKTRVAQRGPWCGSRLRSGERCGVADVPGQLVRVSWPSPLLGALRAGLME